MDSLIQDTLELLQELSKTTPSVLATAEEVAYFTPRASPKKKEPSQATLPPLEKKSVPKPPAQKPEPKPEPEVPIQKNISFPERNHLQEIQQAVQKIFPDLSLRETPPDDAIAKRMSKIWEESYLSAQVVLIAFGEVGPGMDFLKQVAGAIDRLLVPTQLIEGSSLEKERSWELLLNSPSLKTVICSPWASWKTTSLAKYYRQNGASGEQFLGERKLLLLEPSLMYLKHPDRKRELWKTLNTQLLS